MGVSSFCYFFFIGLAAEKLNKNLFKKLSKKNYILIL